MADRGLKPTATFGGRSATKAKNPAASWRELRGTRTRHSFDASKSAASPILLHRLEFVIQTANYGVVQITKSDVFLKDEQASEK